MKLWLIKFKISNALNDRKPLSPAIGQAIARSKELEHFANAAGHLDRALQSQPPMPAASAALHAGIMRAVRASASNSAPAATATWPRWIPVASGLALASVVVFLSVEMVRPPAAKSLPAGSRTFAVAASSALELGNSLVREAPAAAISPLSDEVLRLNRDLVSAKNFLMASLP